MINNSIFPVRTTLPPANHLAVTEIPPASPFIRSLELIAANRAETGRKRPVMLDGTSPFVRFAVLNLMRCR